MPTSPLRRVVDHLRRVAYLQAGAALKDEDLLKAFIVSRDDAAFETLVRRHGPMVMGVCRRVLRDSHHAEDAFQATFMVLIRKAASLSRRERLVKWLYGVANRTALQAKKQAARRRAKERDAMSQPKTGRDEAADEILAHLDEELSRLPDKYRVPIILCDLQGKTRKEAAAQLGVPEGTLSTWLMRGRAALAKRLKRYGTVLSGSALALSQKSMAAVPPGLVAATVKAGSLLAAGKAVSGAVSITVVALTEGVVKMMLVSKLKLVAVAVVCLGVIGAGVGSFRVTATGTNQRELRQQLGTPAAVLKSDQEVQAPKQADQELLKPKLAVEQFEVAAIDLAQGFIKASILRTNAERTLWSHIGGNWQLMVSPATKITIDGKDAKLADLQAIKPGDDQDRYVIVDCEYVYEDRVVKTNDGIRKVRAIRIDAKGRQVNGIVKNIDFTKSTIVTQEIWFVAFGEEVREVREDIPKRSRPGERLVNGVESEVAPDALVQINGKAAKFGDLKPNMQVALQMSAIKKLLVVGITALGNKVDGAIRTVNPEEHTVSVHVPRVQMTSENIPVAKDAKIVVGSVLAKLSDLQPGMRVTLQMSAARDESLIVGITAEKAKKE